MKCRGIFSRLFSSKHEHQLGRLLLNRLREVLSSKKMEVEQDKASVGVQTTISTRKDSRVSRQHCGNSCRSFEEHNLEFFEKTFSTHWEIRSLGTLFFGFLLAGRL